MYYQEKLNIINSKLKVLENGGKTVVWPCGRHTLEMFGRTNLSKYLRQIEFADENKAGETYIDMQIECPEDIKWSEVKYVIISSLKYQEEIKARLLQEFAFTGKIIDFYREDVREFYDLYDAVHGISWGEDHQTWSDAEKLCAKGYKDKKILDACINTTVELSKTRHIPDYFLVSHIIATYLNYGKVIIVDYGGALGGEYFKNKCFLDDLHIEYTWCVIEQRHIIDYGRKHFEESKLKFYYELEDVLERYEKSNYVVYMRASLQYLPDAYGLISKFEDLHSIEIILDDTPMAEQEHIVIQKVRDYIYTAEYPVRIFDIQKLRAAMNNMNYHLVESTKKMDMHFSNFDAEYQRLVFKLQDIIDFMGDK